MIAPSTAKPAPVRNAAWKPSVRAPASGYMYKEIAHRLSISSKTVEAHASAVLRKLQLSSRHELTRWATERRLVEP